MDTGANSYLAPLLAGLQLLEHEMVLFAAFWFIVGALDEFAVDILYLWLRLSGRLKSRTISRDQETRPLCRRTALFVPAWHESNVIRHMLAHTLTAWPQDRLTVYVGCYRNDAQTLEAAMQGAAGDSRVRLVLVDKEGPTTKADCLNRLYAAMSQDEDRRGEKFESVIFHDAEDMVHPAALCVIDEGLAHSDFVQLPVRPEPQPASRWIAGHYADEFAEAHGKTLTVRDALGSAIPAAGVGCGFARGKLADLAMLRARAGAIGPFAQECLTEDYELCSSSHNSSYAQCRIISCIAKKAGQFQRILHNWLCITRRANSRPDGLVSRAYICRPSPT